VSFTADKAIEKGPSGPFSDVTKGILFCLLAILFFTLMDATTKGLAGRYDPLQVVWARYSGQVLLVGVLLAPRLGRVLRTAHPVMHAMRSVCQFGATACFFLSLRHIGLAEATAIMDINPVLITLAAALVLGERIGPRRAFGIAAALIGALIVIRPGAGVFQPAALLPLAAAVFYAAFAVMTRKMGPSESIWTSLIYTALFGTIIASGLMLLYWQPIAPADLWAFALVGCLGTLGQLCLIRAFTLAEASMIAPFGYSGLILASFWGWLFYDTLPDAATVLGALVIVGAGLYVWHRESAASRAARQRE
jgi:drug/metabolite transporter (DMT)-like permease